MFGVVLRHLLVIFIVACIVAAIVGNRFDVAIFELLCLHFIIEWTSRKPPKGRI